MASIKKLSKVIPLLERLSLVEFGSSEAIKRLEAAVELADLMAEVDTTEVEPMVSVLENNSLYLRDDVCVKTTREAVTRNASQMIEDYFVAPIITGNHPQDKRHTT